MRRKRVFDVSSMHRFSGARTLVVEAEPQQPKVNKGFDWYGNSPLAALVGRDDGTSPSVAHQVVYLIEQYPAALRTRSQFSRLPIHYALDKLSRKVNVEVVRLLLEACPESASVCDFEGLSSLDLCEKWEHSDAVFRLVLEAQPDVFQHELNVFRHPIFYRAMTVLQRLFRSRRSQPDDEYNNTTQEEEDSQELVPASSDSPRSESSTLDQGTQEDHTKTRLNNEDEFTTFSLVRQDSDSTTLVTVDGLLGRQDSITSESTRVARLEN